MLERPPGWEYSFFGAVLAEEMNADQDLKWDLAYGLKMSHIHRLDDLPLMYDWLQQKLNDMEALVLSAGQLMNQAIQEAAGKPGEPGDPEHLVYVARRLARIRKELVNWSIEFGCTRVQPVCERLLSLLSSASKDVIEKVESIPSKLDDEIAKAVEANKRGEKYVANVTLEIEMSNNEEICAEFQKLSQLVS